MTVLDNLLQLHKTVLVKPVIRYEIWIDNSNHAYDLPGNWVLFALTSSLEVAVIIIESELDRRFNTEWFYNDLKYEYELLKSHKTVGRIKTSR